jgi:hypothetical protein
MTTFAHPFLSFGVPRVPAPSDVAAGCLNLAQERLRTTLADVAAFRTFCGVATQGAALARIHHEGLPKAAGESYTLAEMQAYRPYAFIWTDDSQGFTKQHAAGGVSHWFRAAGRLHVILVREVPAALIDNEPAADFDFKNHLGLILDGLGELAGQPGYLAISRMSVLRVLEWNDRDAQPTEGISQGCEIEIAWGAEGGG